MNVAFKILTLLIVVVPISWSRAMAQDEDCLACHEDTDLTVERGGKEVSVFVEEKQFLSSIHGDLACTDCHTGFDEEEIPHKAGENIYKVDCSECHDTEEFSASVHGAKGLECHDCHSKHEIQPVKKAFPDVANLCVTCHKSYSVKSYNGSIHRAKWSEKKGGPTCVDCHSGATHTIRPAKLSEDELHAVCASCHPDPVKQFEESLHGLALKHGKFLAPNCVTCHGVHGTLAADNPRSKTYVMNIPSLCGDCHKDGTKVSTLQTVSQRHVLEDYSESIHGDGLFKRGLIVTAVCTSCHFSHNILPHENSKSSINRNNIAKTCTQCHQQIEAVHKKVIRGELWEKQPHMIPACIDCHQPHKVRRVFYDDHLADDYCLSCHENQALNMNVAGNRVSLYVDSTVVRQSAHAENSCIKCHINVSVANDPVCKGSGKVDCSICHAEEVGDYQLSQHGKFHADGNPNAPYCVDCHGTHDTERKDDYNSKIFARNIPTLCGKCHQEGNKAAVEYKGQQHDVIKNYTMSIHGKGLLKSGLMVTATCIDCHTTHRELPAVDPMSSVNKENIATTCSKCHLGIYEEFEKSVHSRNVSEKANAILPGCSDCHLSHTIQRVDENQFRKGIMDQCGKCHEDVAETYFDTFHGKVSKLGSVKTAKCHDCHGAHNILPTYNPESTLSRRNVIQTCGTCHPNSNRKFVGYLTHATHHDADKYPFLFYTFWGMTGLLIGTFTFFGLHTLLWFPRALKDHRKRKKALRLDPKADPSGRENGDDAEVSDDVHTTQPEMIVTAAGVLSPQTHVQRFDPFSRFLHILVIVSFLSLAVTGMIIKFSGVGVFQFLSNLMGGYEVTGFIHRVAAVITFGYFALHIGHLIRRKRKEKFPLSAFFKGEDSMMPRKQDVIEFWQTIKWFLGKGPRPQYGRWTYWEKFDYLAVFWGVAVIGISGLLLWFPEFFTGLGIPGPLINVATIIHSDEALLATGFIFTVHFFNTHFRPDKFPMDPVIFTGSVTLEELKDDRPREYEDLVKRADIADHIVEPPLPWLKRAARVFGFTALSIGILIIVLIIYAMIFLYE